MTNKILTMLFLLLLSFIFSCIQGSDSLESQSTSTTTEISEIEKSNEHADDQPSDITNFQSTESSETDQVPQPKIKSNPKKPEIKLKSENKETFKDKVDKDRNSSQNEEAELSTDNGEEDTKVKSHNDLEIKSMVVIDHSIFNTLLSQHVSSIGKVNYVGFKKDISKLNQYLEQLAKDTPQSSWSRDEIMAYWINAYNAFTVKLIVDNYPLNSIMDLHNGNPWDVKWIKLGDKTYSLNQMEHDILRPKYKDARIHFAVNCAAKSCPPILNEAWTADNLQRLLDQQAKRFINNSTFNKLANEKVQLSKIFEWYAEDFGDIIPYLNKYASIKINSDANVSYIDYDWALNN